MLQSSTDGRCDVTQAGQRCRLQHQKRAEIRRHRPIGMPPDREQARTSRLLCCVADFPQQHTVCPALLK